MRLFRRIGDIIAANLNVLVDRFEDPEVMLRQAIREMEAMIDDATAGAARAIASERLLVRDLADHEQKARRWNARAEEAVRSGDDDLARQAITRGFEHQAMAQALQEQRSSAERSAQALRSQINAMRAKHDEARRKLASLSARSRMAEAGRALRGMTNEAARECNGFARFERMHRHLDQAESEAEALAELCESPESRWEAETESREQARRVEAELTAIRERLRTSREPLG
jgi:phage shock protein A